MQIYRIDSVASRKRLKKSYQYDRYHLKDTVLMITLDRYQQLVLRYSASASDTFTIHSSTEKTIGCGMIRRYQSITYQGATVNKQVPL